MIIIFLGELNHLGIHGSPWQSITAHGSYARVFSRFFYEYYFLLELDQGWDKMYPPQP